jgi:hypothetical protein
MESNHFEYIIVLTLVVIVATVALVTTSSMNSMNKNLVWEQTGHPTGDIAFEQTLAGRTSKSKNNNTQSKVTGNMVFETRMASRRNK